MGEIIQLPDLDIDCSKFTPEGLDYFRKIPKYIMKQILETVFCPTCGTGTTIIAFSGKMLDRDLILRGKCKKCWGEVERLVSDKEEIFFRITS